MSASLNASRRIAVRLHAREQGKGAILEFHHDALERLLRFLVRNLEQLQIDRLVLAEHLSRRDAKQQRVADLPGGARDGDTNGRLYS